MGPGVHATVVTAGHCMHAELTCGSGLVFGLLLQLTCALPQSMLINWLITQKVKILSLRNFWTLRELFPTTRITTTRVAF